ncbi:MAG: UDP-N-acetylmuramoyl-L-alanyl-D-glutamate--2,6-diaminopimelate ligase [Pseudomonadota bacterium]
MTSKLRDLLGILAAPTDFNPLVLGLTDDSRQVKPGYVFFAVCGEVFDGRQFIQQALDAGAVAVISEPLDVSTFNDTPHVIEVSRIREIMGQMACRFYDNIVQEMAVYAVTGTNGKTSVAYFIAQLLQQVGKPCAYMGTLGVGLLGNLEVTGNTTVGSLALHEKLSQFYAQGIRHIAIEVSSHALEQQRIAGCPIKTAIFTNLTQDHLDYHKTMENYWQAKMKLFKRSELSSMVICTDDAYGVELIQTTLTQARNKLAVGVDAQQKFTDSFCEYEILKRYHNGMEIRAHSHWGRVLAKLPLVGDFNVSNALLAFSALCLDENISFNQDINKLEKLLPVPGRMQKLVVETDNSFTERQQVVIDYAHTPDALEKALIVTRQHCEGRLWLVFGCGGERDKPKRPIMGSIAESLADKVIITNDNPRNESELDIIKQIEEGMKNTDRVTRILDRQEAITFAITQASKNDWVLIAGKGHEDYQDIAGKRIVFSDEAVATNVLMERTS